MWVRLRRMEEGTISGFAKEREDVRYVLAALQRREREGDALVRCALPAAPQP
jgi:hypothetical protein